MGSPSNFEIVTGSAQIQNKELSTTEWCEIMEAALFRIKPYLKYLAGFQTLAKLLNSVPMTGLGRLITPNNALPKLEDLSEKTRFVAVYTWEPCKSPSAEPSHEVRRYFLLLTDAGNFAILTTSSFKQEDHYAVCASSLIASHNVGGMNFVLNMGAPMLRNLIDDGSISPYNVLDMIYLLFCSDVKDAEKRLDSKREARDLLKGMLDRVAI